MRRLRNAGAVPDDARSRGGFHSGTDAAQEAVSGPSMSDTRSPGDVDRSLLDRAIRLHDEDRVREAITRYRQLHEADPLAGSRPVTIGDEGAPVSVGQTERTVDLRARRKPG